MGKNLMLADILDVCCGPRMFYDRESKDREDTIYMDVRDNVDISYTHANGTVSEWHIRPDIVGDFRSIPFEDGRFSLVIFGPPHLARVTETGVIARKYGRLSKEWKRDLREGFDECFRVLRPGGFLNFKWSEAEIPLAEVTPLFPQRPIYYQRQGLKGAWFMFRKEGGDTMRYGETPERRADALERIARALERIADAEEERIRMAGEAQERLDRLDVM
ncbi:MAG: hypothetical protein IKR86_09185 [Candidatus Methanomethylophilaceae archaeon]|nr:hypothetical protein [Candidatus Methanomethylophilaceae archaeon]